MPTLEFVQIDVFTDRAFGGNQLAVFLDASGLTTAEMQTVAREMNFSESTFVLPPEQPGHAARVRIFTPGLEMPMAGHPTVGTGLVLLERGVLSGQGHAILELNIGPTRIDIESVDSRPFVWMTQRQPEFEPAQTDRATVAAALGLTKAELASNLPVQVVSTGVRYLLVPLKDVETLAKARFHQSALEGLFTGQAEVLCAYIFAPVNHGVLRARMFDPLPNEPPEDPATGSAAGPLAAYAVQHGMMPDGQFLIEQGIEMGRPSRIHVKAQREEGGIIRSVQVGGGGVIVGRGEIYW